MDALRCGVKGLTPSDGAFRKSVRVIPGRTQAPRHVSRYWKGKMANKKNNRSAQRTQRLIKEAFVKLASERALSQVSVLDVAEHADVSRGTFYLYFHDLLDLRDVIADDFVDAFDQQVGLHEKAGHPMRGGFEMLEAGFSFMRDNADTLGLLLGPNGDVAFQRRFENVIRRYCFAGLGDNFPGLSKDVLERYYSYAIAGAVGSIRDWLSRGCEESPHDMSDFVGTILIAGARALSEGVSGN